MGIWKIEMQDKVMDKNRDFKAKYFLHIDQRIGNITSLFLFHFLISSLLHTQSNAFAASKCLFHKLKVALSSSNLD